jgi:sulfur-carrier protein
MKVLIPTPLYSYTQGAEVEASGATLAEVVADLERQFPGIRFRMIDEQDRMRPHIRFFVNRQIVRELGEPLGEDDEVAIVQALSGG